MPGMGQLDPIDGGYRVTIDGLPPINSASRRHWATERKIRIAWQELMIALLAPLRPEVPYEALRVVFTP